MYAAYNDDCFYYYKNWFSTLDSGWMCSNLFEIWHYQWFCVHIFCFSLSKEKICWKTMELVQDLNLPPSIYIHTCTLYTYTNTHMLRFRPSWFFGPSRCLISTPGLTTEYSICAVCACECVYTHTPTYTPTRVTNTEDTDNTSISPSVKNNPPRQTTSDRIDYLDPPQSGEMNRKMQKKLWGPQRWMNTGEYLLAAEMEVPYSTGSVFLGLLIPRRSWLISISTIHTWAHATKDAKSTARWANTLAHTHAKKMEQYNIHDISCR